MNKNLYRAKLAENGMTQAELARKLNMSEPTLIRKVKSDTLKIREAKEMVNILNIDSIYEIFFTQ